MQSSMLHDMLPQYSAMNFTPSSKDGHTSPDTSLTSLNWLPDFKIADFQFSESSLLPPCSAAANTCSSISDDVFSSTTGSADSDREVEKEPELCPVIPLSPLKRCMNQAAEFDRNPWKYRENPKKPPFAYTALIYLAIRSTNKEKVMLGDIYQWIKDHFMYYRIAESTWQNSVRHNLSLNEFFVKIPRSEGDPGKGSFWQVNPNYEFFLSNEGELKRLQEQQNNQKLPVQKSKSKGRRRLQSATGSGNKTSSASTKRRSKSVTLFQKEEVCPLPGDLNWATLLSTQKANYGSCGDIVCRPSYSSPILGPDLAHIGDPVVCSPAVIPHTLTTRTLETPPMSQTYTSAPTAMSGIDDLMESPSILLPAWAESRPQSPVTEHPWAETSSSNKPVSSWSPDTPWTVSLTGYTTDSNKRAIAQLI